MMPFIHLGPVTLATYGLLVGAAMIAAYFVLSADFRRRGIAAPADLFIAVPCIAGLVGAKLYHLLESPREFFAHPVSLFFSQYGFAWFGGFIGGFLAFVLLARHYRQPLLALFDAASPAAALGYGVGRIGCLISGDGDYGIPTSLPWGMSFPHGLVPTTEKVHPTPIYEFLVAALIFWYLWRLGARQARAAASGNDRAAESGAPRSAPAAASGFRKFFLADMAAWKRPPRGEVFAQYLVLTGVARFLVEFIRINPRSFFGLTNAQAASLASVLLGVALLWHLRRAGATAPSAPRR